MKENFVGWSGDVHSPLTELNLTMDSPKTVNADFSVDYRPLAILVILGIGFAVAAISLLLLRRRMRATVVSEPPETPVQAEGMTCPTCGQLTEEGWAHCIKCGAKLTGSTSVQS
jgi:hypothetical protein